MSIVDEQPRTGGRILFELCEDGAPDDANQSIAYEVTLTTADSTFCTRVSMDLNTGEIHIDAWRDGGVPPSWLAKAVSPLLRQQWNGWKNSGARWPRRIHRWRADPSPQRG